MTTRVSVSEDEIQLLEKAMRVLEEYLALHNTPPTQLTVTNLPRRRTKTIILRARLYLDFLEPTLEVLEQFPGKDVFRDFGECDRIGTVELVESLGNQHRLVIRANQETSQDLVHGAVARAVIRQDRCKEPGMSSAPKDFEILWVSVSRAIPAQMRTPPVPEQSRPSKIEAIQRIITQDMVGMTPECAARAVDEAARAERERTACFTLSYLTYGGPGMVPISDEANGLFQGERLYACFSGDPNCWNPLCMGLHTLQEASREFSEAENSTSLRMGDKRLHLFKRYQPVLGTLPGACWSTALLIKRAEL